MSKELVPFAAMLAAVLLIYIPRLFVARGQAQQPEGFDNANPRVQQAKLTGLASRARGAHENSFEAFAPFAAGVLACKVGGVDSDEIAMLSMAFVALRTVYLVAYLKDMPTFRSAVWFLAFGISLALLALPLFA
jgi:uncharacterized MAPEG superfamily protein